MKVKRLQLQNYGRFEDLNIDFAPTAEKTSNVTVIVGNNGAGKSQILQALATGLSWFVNGLLYYSGEKVSHIRSHSETILFPHEGEYVDQSRIMNNRNKVKLDLVFSDMYHELKGLSISTTRKEVLKPAIYGTDDNGFNYLIGEYAKNFESNKKSNLPLIANYTTDRNVEVDSIDASFSFLSDQLSAYTDFMSAGSNYDEFFQWFRDNEDVENEINRDKVQNQELNDIEIQLYKLKNKKEVIEEIINDVETEREMSLYHSLSKIIADIDSKEIEINQLSIRSDVLAASVFKGFKSQLKHTKNAIEHFTNFKNVRIRRLNKPTMIVEKDGEGVVMIDEVDLHLHPKWQHDLIDKFVKTFPNVQFILTTHSPHVISDRPDILVYALDDGELTQVPNVYGEDVNTVLTKVFDVPIRDPKAQADFDKVAELIYQKKFESAENYIIKLEKQMPENLELLRCRLHLTQAQLAAKKEG